MSMLNMPIEQNLENNGIQNNVIKNNGLFRSYPVLRKLNRLGDLDNCIL
jgi:hypothetical protein